MSTGGNGEARQSIARKTASGHLKGWGSPRHAKAANTGSLF
nr:MAG TPA: hypothetical protein [Caudoviricetes sp.]DAX98305.1 MAG TPA: hypothetical protein [Caudoviricetes sp.]